MGAGLGRGRDSDRRDGGRRRGGPVADRPLRGLLLYAEADGLDSHARDWEATAAAAILRQRSTGAMVADVSRRILDRILKLVPGQAPTGDDLIALHQQIARCGFAPACHDDQRRTATTFIVTDVRGGEVPRRLERLLRLTMGTEPGAKVATARGHELALTCGA
jgi:hypothetical protein